MKAVQIIWDKLNQGSLVLQIIIGIFCGALIGGLSSNLGEQVSHLGTFFVLALKAVAPILVFVLVIASISNQKLGTQSHIGPVIQLYLIGTFLAALTAVAMSFLFPTMLTLQVGEQSISPPNGIGEVLSTLLFKIVDNPINALLNANYIGILAWAICLGLLFRKSSDSTRQFLQDTSEAISTIVHGVIRLAPFGIMGLVAGTVAATGFSEFANYGRILFVLVGSMFIIALVANPLIVFFKTKQNPYPLVFQCLRESGITAFFTRSSAANIPVNLELCKKLNLHEDTYSVSIPIGATINMAGAAITITVLTLATAHTLNIQVDFITALLLSLVAAVSACGASGVAGGSLLLIPLACSLFQIPNEVAMQVVAMGFIIGVIQDSCETALNSSTDVIFTAAAERAKG